MVEENQGSPYTNLSFKKRKMKRNKLGQEEMIGFAMIIIIVAVVVLVFIGFSIRNQQTENVESYEVESFLQSALQYTTDCENNLERFSVQKLIFACYSKEQCLDGRKSCDALKDEMTKMLNESWRIGEERPVKGYDLIIRTDKNESILGLSQGEITSNSKGAVQDFARGERLIEIIFKAYY
ncbi:MAG: hypothetical protein AABX93_01455 [Nanoarchaeota archaeon]